MALAIESEVYEQLKEDIVAGVKAGGEVEILQLPGEPDDVYLLCQRGKEPQRLTAARRRNDTIGSLADVIALVKSDLTDGKRTVWSGANSVVVLYSDADDARKRDRGTYSFAFAPEFLVLEELFRRWKEPNSKGLGQKDFVTLLKTRLFNAFATDGERKKLLKQLSNIVTSGTSEIGQSSATIILDAKSKVADDQIEEFPETITFRVAVLIEDDVDTAEEIVCILDISPKGDEFKLVPVEADLIHSRRYCAVLVAEHLKSQLPDTIVVTGTP